MRDAAKMIAPPVMEETSYTTKVGADNTSSFLNTHNTNNSNNNSKTLVFRRHLSMPDGTLVPSKLIHRRPIPMMSSADLTSPPQLTNNIMANSRNATQWLESQHISPSAAPQARVERSSGRGGRPPVATAPVLVVRRNFTVDARNTTVPITLSSVELVDEWLGFSGETDIYRAAISDDIARKYRKKRVESQRPRRRRVEEHEDIGNEVPILQPAHPAFAISWVLNPIPPGYVGPVVQVDFYPSVGAQLVKPNPLLSMSAAQLVRNQSIHGRKDVHHYEYRAVADMRRQILRDVKDGSKPNMMGRGVHDDDLPEQSVATNTHSFLKGAPNHHHHQYPSHIITQDDIVATIRRVARVIDPLRATLTLRVGNDLVSAFHLYGSTGLPQFAVPEWSPAAHNKQRAEFGRTNEKSEEKVTDAMRRAGIGVQIRRTSEATLNFPLPHTQMDATRPVVRYVTVRNTENHPVEFRLLLLSRAVMLSDEETGAGDHKDGESAKEKPLDFANAVFPLMDALAPWITYNGAARNKQPHKEWTSMTHDDAKDADAWLVPSGLFELTKEAQRQPTVLYPGESARLGPVLFHPNGTCTADSTPQAAQNILLLRNNDTIFEAVRLQAECHLPSVVTLSPDMNEGGGSDGELVLHTGGSPGGQNATIPSAPSSSSSPSASTVMRTDATTTGAPIATTTIRLNVTESHLRAWLPRESGHPSLHTLLTHFTQSAEHREQETVIDRQSRTTWHHLWDALLLRDHYLSPYHDENEDNESNALMNDEDVVMVMRMTAQADAKISTNDQQQAGPYNHNATATVTPSQLVLARREQRRRRQLQSPEASLHNPYVRYTLGIHNTGTHRVYIHSVWVDGEMARCSAVDDGGGGSGMNENDAAAWEGDEDGFDHRHYHRAALLSHLPLLTPPPSLPSLLCKVCVMFMVELTPSIVISVYDVLIGCHNSFWELLSKWRKTGSTSSLVMSPAFSVW